ncbi:MAG TPA: M24 family metallopeptidase [Leptospiraceae bacterium]|nr:M24 family metallopeptidase [Leptospiraceae bacterium]HMY68869.1 M24 family metallopeptidase [Leptospiraceae bacterium]HMZ57271.1 M24 family metallopeptidase [Leptospiraceae bacterium]HNF12099.1 M24 family metallopeptidase [Leptospiraceae bacterium]HNF27689.1 M24 family metallopeptidase [Leptospiraceae bacterium]
MSAETYSRTELEKFKFTQKLAYEAVVNVRAQLREGMTEKQASALIDEYLKRKKVDGFFHYGFAWFGDRTAFTGFKKPLDLGGFVSHFSPPHLGLEFMPSDLRLKKGMPVILDVAPIVDGCAADIGYAFAFGENPDVDRAVMDLEVFRPEILDMVRKEKTLSEIYARTDRIIRDMGYVNCHALYPAGVLGHKVGKIPMTWIPETRIMGFQVQTFAYLLGQAAAEIFDSAKNRSPLWNSDTDVRAEKGLWAVEPHMGKNGNGVKWEEILVVTENNAYWLDDDLPHVNFWKENKKAAAI